MNEFYIYIQDLINNPLASLAIVGNLILIEGILSIDNAALLATMIVKLKKEDREKAFRYGIFGAYLFRGICLIFASFLIKIWWLKPLGGAYLLYLAIDYFFFKKSSGDSDKLNKKKSSFLSKSKYLSPLWSTIISIELMDLAFSIDNVLAAVAFSENLLLIYLGVFLGILSMRFVAKGFISVMKKYPFLEKSAFMVIFILGAKLLFSLYEKTYPLSWLTQFMKSENADLFFSLLTVLIFVLPIFFNYLHFRKKIKL